MGDFKKELQRLTSGKEQNSQKKNALIEKLRTAATNGHRSLTFDECCIDAACLNFLISEGIAHERHSYRNADYIEIRW